MADIKELQDKLKKNPNDLQLIESYAIALSDIGENEEALKNFVYLNKQCPQNPKILYNIGIILEKLKYIDKSIAAYRKALSFSPEDTDIMFNLANVYILKNQLDEAELLLLKVIEIDSDDSNAFFHLGEIYSKKKNHEKAIDFLTKSLELNENDIVAKFYLAYELNAIGEIDSAIEIYQDVITQNPDYSWAYYNLAAIYIARKDENNALRYLELTIRVNPTDMQAIRLYIKLLFKNKKYSQAEKCLRQYIHDLPNEADLCFLIAQAYKQLKNRINYVKYLKLAKKMKNTFSGNFEKLEAEIREAEKK